MSKGPRELGRSLEKKVPEAPNCPATGYLIWIGRGCRTCLNFANVYTALRSLHLTHQHHWNLQVPATNKGMRWHSICYLIRTFNYLLAVGNPNLPWAQDEFITTCGVCYEGWSNWLSSICLLINSKTHGNSEAVPSVFIPLFLFIFGKKFTALSCFNKLWTWKGQELTNFRCGFESESDTGMKLVGFCLELWALAQTMA